VAVPASLHHKCATKPVQSLPSHGIGNDSHGQSPDFVENDIGLEVDAAARVIEDIQHTEPPLVVEENEAGVVAMQTWASMVERHLGTVLISNENANANEDPALVLDEIFILQFNRRPNEFFDALGNGVALRCCRQALSDNGHAWRLITGTMVFVHPWQYHQVMQALKGRELKRSQLVVATSLEHLVEESIAGIGHGVWANQRQSLVAVSDAHPSTTSVAAEPGSDDADHVELNRMIFERDVDWTAWPDMAITRSFICSAPRLLRSATVVQSTTEMNSRNGRNPRRAAAHDDTP